MRSIRSFPRHIWFYDNRLAERDARTTPAPFNISPMTSTVNGSEGKRQQASMVAVSIGKRN